MKLYIKISIVYILCPFLFAQKIPVNPDHNVYHYLYRQSTNGILPQWIQSVRPLTIDQVLSLLNEVKKNDEINNSTRILAEQFISEFISPTNSEIKLPFSKNNKLNQLLSYNIKDIEPHLLSIKNDSSSLWIDWSEDLVISTSNDYQMYFRDKISLNTIIISTELQDNICSICLDDFKNEEIINKLKCNHIIHRDCLGTWFNDNKEGRLVNIRKREKTAMALEKVYPNINHLAEIMIDYIENPDKITVHSQTARNKIEKDYNWDDRDNIIMSTILL